MANDGYFAFIDMKTMVAGMFQNSNEKRTNSINKDVHQSNDYSHSMKQ